MKFHGLNRVGRTIGVPVALSMTMLGAPSAETDSSGPEWTLTAGTEYGRDDSRGYLMSVDYVGKNDPGTAENSSQRGQVAFGVSGLHSDTPTASVSDSTTASGTTATTSGLIYFRYGIEALRGGVAFNTTGDQDYRDTQQWTVMLHPGAHGWAIDVDVSTRQTHFDGFPISGSEVLRQDQTITTDSNANCTLHDIGYGGSLTYRIGSWSTYRSGSANKYDNTACSYSVAEPNALQRLSSYDFQSLSGTLLDRAQLARRGSNRSAESVITIAIRRGRLAFMGARGAGTRLPACQGGIRPHDARRLRVVGHHSGAQGGSGQTHRQHDNHEFRERALWRRVRVSQSVGDVT